MKVRLTEDNREAIEAALKTAQSARMHVNTLDAGDVLALVPDLDRRLHALLPTAAHKGVRYIYHAAGPSAKAYSYRQGATEIHAERGSEYWFLTDVKRVEIYPKATATDLIYLDRGHSAAVLNRALDAQGATIMGVPQL